MKKYLFLFVVMVPTINLIAQITYEHTYTAPPRQVNNIFLTNLGNDNYKYVVWDYNQSSFSMYNLDHSPFILNIQVPIVGDSGHYYAIGYITSTLFDCDSTNIEYAIIGKYVSYTKKFMIYRTDGTQLFTRDSVTTLFCVGCLGGSQEMLGIENTPVGTKLYLITQFPDATEEMYVYGLCGTLPENITKIENENSYVQVFPNPSSSQINFNISIPNHLEKVEKYELVIFNSSLQTIQTFIVDKTNIQVHLDAEPLSSGEYYFSLQSKNKVFQYGQFILTK